MSKVFYLGYYDVPENIDENRNVCLAATNKMTYIVSAIEKAGYMVELISVAQTHNPKKYKGKILKICENSNLILFKTLPWGNKFKRIVSSYYSKSQLIKHIFKNVKKGDTLLVYHSVAYADIIRILKKIKNFKLVLEVEEIYADVTHSEKFRQIEQKIFNVADSYIFPTELLEDTLNADKKPSAVIYGTYKTEEVKNSCFNDEKIHVVYAGVFDLDKGVLTAVESAKYLDKNYHLHILGFGTENDTNSVKEKIAHISKEYECKITYHGKLYGEEYLHFIQSCHIGLSPQNNQATFNETSFPSKVLSYLSNGLRVVSVRIKSIESSAVSELISFYDDNSPQALANAIKKIDFSDGYDSRKVVSDLDCKFIKDIGVLLNN